ncbi:MAG TPA: hypothetical protein ENN66_08670 [Proteobacteria bacterium]|nr:hypothetical protein [Pseudomonadota bacterium]
MGKRINVVMMIVLTMLFGRFGMGWAHSPIFTCFTNGDGSLTCEGAFSDGSDAAGATIEVRDGLGKLLSRGRLDFTGTIELEKPAADSFEIIFDGGPGHQLKIKSCDIPR